MKIIDKKVVDGNSIYVLDNGIEIDGSIQDPKVALYVNMEVDLYEENNQKIIKPTTHFYENVNQSTSSQTIHEQPQVEPVISEQPIQNQGYNQKPHNNNFGPQMNNNSQASDPTNHKFSQEKISIITEISGIKNYVVGGMVCTIIAIFMFGFGFWLQIIGVVLLAIAITRMGKLVDRLNLEELRKNKK